MKAIRGHLVITIDSDFVIGVRDASLQIQMQTVSAANPNGGPWGFVIPGRQRWNVTFNTLNMRDDPQLVRPGAQRLIDRMAHDRELVEIKLETPYGATYSGTGYITGHGFSVTHSEAFGMQYGLEGVGELVLSETELTCGLNTIAGDNDPVQNDHYIGTQAGWVHCVYFGGSTIPDEFKIHYDGQVVASTAGAVTGHGSISFYYEAETGKPRTCTVEVIPDPDPGTVWRYILLCPTSSSTPPDGLEA